MQKQKGVLAAPSLVVLSDGERRPRACAECRGLAGHGSDRPQVDPLGEGAGHGKPAVGRGVDQNVSSPSFGLLCTLYLLMEGELCGGKNVETRV